MEKKELIKFLDEIFKPLEFKRKGNTWKNKNEVFVKIINLQKSKYSNAYYLNYGFIIKDLDLNNLEMHIYNRLSSINDSENQKIMDLLDMENSIAEDKRKSDLKMFIDKYLLTEIQNTNTENDLVNALKKRPHLNDIPLVVKRHLQLD
jgi:hypothetical protein